MSAAKNPTGMADNSKLGPLQSLVDAFRNLLDEALIVAIANDYNLHDPSAYHAVHATLQGLSRNVPSEEATGFNPSGIPMLTGEESDGARDELTISTSISRAASQTHVTDPSSTDTSSTAAEPSADIPRLTSFDNDSEESKELLLQSMFTELKEFDIKHSLKRANGDFQAALDDLLNIQYLKSTGQQMKGIDGFFQLDDAPTCRSKRKKKKKAKGKAASEAAVLQDQSPYRGDGQDEIEYIAERFGIRSDEVSDLYHSNRYSAGATVAKLLDQYLSHGIETRDEAGRQHADDLARKYCHIPGKYLPTVVHVAGSIPQFADDISALLNAHFSKQPNSQKLDLGYRLTPLPRDEIEGEWQQVAPTKRAASKPTTGLVASSWGLAQALQAANNHEQARRDTLETAAQLHRRGASSPLYRQAASFYTDRAREQAKVAQQATSSAADILVEQQSTHEAIDLHGVLGHDGVRIALQKTRDWWQGLGESRARRAREQGLTIITGLGRHNTGGVSRLRQAVAAALLQDGWKFRVETGKFVLAGRR